MKLVTYKLFLWITIILAFMLMSCFTTIFPKLIVLFIGLFCLYVGWVVFLMDKKQGHTANFDFIVITEENDIERHLK